MVHSIHPGMVLITWNIYTGNTLFGGELKLNDQKERKTYHQSLPVECRSLNCVTGGNRTWFCEPLQQRKLIWTRNEGRSEAMVEWGVSNKAFLGNCNMSWDLRWWRIYWENTLLLEWPGHNQGKWKKQLYLSFEKWAKRKLVKQAGKKRLGNL